MPGEIETSGSAPSSLPAVIKVAIIEEQPEIRDCLESLINGAEGYACAGSFCSLEEALEKMGVAAPDVMFVELGLPGMSGIEGIRLLKERCPEAALLMLTACDDDDRIFDALCAGATGCLLKKTPPLRLLESLKEAVMGGAPMSPEVTRCVLRRFREIHPPERAEYHLTPHEIRLLKLLVEGHNRKTAAVELGVSIHAVSFHLRSIYSKLQVHSKSEAVAKALRNRLV